MSQPPVAIDGTSIVLAGSSFGALNLSPKWLLDNNVIGESDARNVSYELLIPNEAVIFRTGWLRCTSNAQALEFQTEVAAEFERLRDAVIALLRASPEVPISQMGINRNIHFRVDEAKAWHAIGDSLVHNEIWDGVLHLAGMRTVTYWGSRTDDYRGRVHVQIEPSVRFAEGVFIAYNDHYDLIKGVAQPKSREDTELFRIMEDRSASVEKIPVAIEILETNWNNSMQQFERVVETVWSKAD